ncbi:MAG TPA: inorganic phosphate transporter [Phycisphaerae bacterium]|nr:inorganic phosphate transporter [Phycisphaerae bacterium]
MLEVGGGLFLGWSLGANDAANVFGTAVAARVIRFSTAAAIAGVAVVAGACLEGGRGIETLSAVSNSGVAAAVITSVCAAVTVTVMTLLRLPVSTSQAVVGAIIGVAIVGGDPDFSGLPKIITCWVATPFGAIVVACLSYSLLGVVMNRLRISMLTRDRLLWGALVVVGAYAAYALGANNVANVTGVYYRTGTFDSTTELALIGGISIAAGVATYGRRVMTTIGADLVHLDAYAALIAIFAQGVTVHVFAKIGVPVSTSQALVGGVIGVGFMRGARGIDRNVLKNIVLGWILTPIAAGTLAGAVARIVPLG